MDKALQSMVDNMPEKTGKPLQEWLKILGQRQFQKHSEAVSFLKEKHGVSHGYANTIVHLSKHSEDQNESELLEQQYQGKKNLRLIYNKLIEHIQSFGNDIEIAPKKSYVSIRRKKQFALIQPSTKSRLDLGLTLKQREPQGKLEASGSFSAMCTHRIRIEETEDITDQVIEWLQKAYTQAG